MQIISRRNGKLGSTLGLTFLALLIMASVFSAGASANPQPTFNSKKYPLPIGGNGGPTEIYGFGSFEGICKGVTVAGSLNNSSGGQMTLTYTGCTRNGLFNPSCTTPGQATGTIVTSPLDFTPVYLDAARTKYGLKLTPIGSETFAQFKCLGIPGSLIGSLIGEVKKPALGELRSTGVINFQRVGRSQLYQQIEESGPNYFLSETASTGKPVETSLTGEFVWGYPAEVRIEP